MRCGGRHTPFTPTFTNYFRMFFPSAIVAVLGQSDLLYARVAATRHRSLTRSVATTQQRNTMR